MTLCVGCDLKKVFIIKNVGIKAFWYIKKFV